MFYDREGRFRGGRRVWGYGKILRYGLKFTITCPPGRVPRLVYASLVASERKLRMTDRTPCSHRAALRLHYSLHNQDDRHRSHSIIDGVEEYTGPERIGAPAQKAEGQSNDKKDSE